MKHITFFVTLFVGLVLGLFGCGEKYDFRQEMIVCPLRAQNTDLTRDDCIEQLAVERFAMAYEFMACETSRKQCEVAAREAKKNPPLDPIWKSEMRGRLAAICLAPTEMEKATPKTEAEIREALTASYDTYTVCRPILLEYGQADAVAKTRLQLIVGWRALSLLAAINFRDGFAPEVECQGVQCKVKSRCDLVDSLVLVNEVNGLDPEALQNAALFDKYARFWAEGMQELFRSWQAADATKDAGQIKDAFRARLCFEVENHRWAPGLSAEQLLQLECEGDS